MSEVENEKDFKCIKIITIIIIYSIIGIIALFTIGISKVDAAVTPFDTIGIREQDVGGDINNFSIISSFPWQDSNQNVNGLSRRKYTLYLSESGLTSNMMLTFNVTLKGTIIYTNTSGVVLNWDTTKLSYKIIGTDNKENSTSCEATQRLTQSYPSNNTTRKEYEIYINCNNISPSANSKQVQIIYDYPSISGSGGKLLQQTLQVENVSQLTYEDKIDNNVITSNNDANTNKIIDNNNYNTERIHEDMNDIYDNINENSENIINSQNETKESVDNINDSINDSSVDDPSSALNGMNNYFGSNGVISDLLLLPVRLFQSIVNTIDGTCSAFNLGTLLGHQLTMPCINLSSRLGSSLYGVIDVLISGFFILTIRKKFVDIFNHFTSLNMGGNELE